MLAALVVTMVISTRARCSSVTAHSASRRAAPLAIPRPVDDDRTQ